MSPDLVEYGEVSFLLNCCASFKVSVDGEGAGGVLAGREQWSGGASGCGSVSAAGEMQVLGRARVCRQSLQPQ